MENQHAGRRAFLTRNFILLAASSFLYVMCSYLLVPMLPLYLGSLGAVETEIGFIVGLTALVAVFTRVPFGRFIDRFGRRGMLLFGIVLQSVSPLLYTVCTDVNQFIAVRALQGIGFAAFVITSHTMVVDISPKGRLGEVLGIFAVCSILAKAIGPSLAGFLMVWFGYISTFYVAAGFGFVATIMALLIMVPPYKPEPGGAGRFRDVLKNRNTSTASLALIAVMMPHGVVSSFFPIYAYSLGIGPEGIGFYFMVYAICTGATRPLVGKLSDRVGRVTVAVPFTLLIIMGMTVFAFAGDLTGFLIAGAMFGMGEGAVLPALMTLAVDTIKPRQRGQAVAVSGTTVDIGISSGAMGMGPVIMSAGYPVAFLSTAAIVVMGTAGFLGIRAVWKKEEKVYT
jgi:predicted MFS family arabinose efflux permease